MKESTLHEKTAVAQKIRVLIVDDDPIVCASLATILTAQADLEVCAEGKNGNEAQLLFDEHKPDVLLMDIQMPECTGLEAAKLILDKHPQARIVFLTTFSDDEYIVAALRLGACGYLIKQEVANIAPALRSVMAGQMVLGTEVVGKVGSLFEKETATSSVKVKEAAAVTAPLDKLTERELEIIQRIAQGLDNKEIAEHIYISEGTLRNHVSVILQKLQLKNRTQIAVYYYQSLG
ncbi:MAG: response regulator transcription factor [Coriobacteriia bacterium]|jgi:DNA-binding NarL/FixJ family response regulator|nr:response regulator transcription factor [Coriobacteriia bacterium]MDR2714422.1 response regulator transcription factor [Coriobacteriales bacterium]